MRIKKIIYWVTVIAVCLCLLSGASAATGQGSGLHNAPSHMEIKPVSVTLADKATLTILETDWLHQTRETHVEEIQPKLSGLFWTFASVLAAAAGLVIFLFGTAMFKRFSLNMKLYTSYGFLVMLTIILGMGGYLYLDRVNGAAHQETAFLDLDMMASEIQVLQNEFLLHGIENKAYGKEKEEEIKALIAEYADDL
ncbi:MAG: hypothetical protein MI802_26340, partial [Desulfobacterales bacterium]|nr:hypothetical protein [Desulfobacterales bacterium]